MPVDFEVCCLCGKPGSDSDEITREHVPPKQFYPKAIRNGLNLWIVPSHKSCNGQTKADEEYFYHALQPLVAKANHSMGELIFKDLERRAKRPQTRSILRKVLSKAETVTPRGILLPPNVVRITPEEWRLQAVAIKIARCLFYRQFGRVMPTENCKDIDRYEAEEDVPEIYKLSWEMTKINLNDLASCESESIVVLEDSRHGRPSGAYSCVFDYRHFHFKEESMHFYSLRFWEAFLYCLAFKAPSS